ncbi:PD-(D/E)XK nuclease family protein [Massilia sp. CCM 9210]|uniref:PDDEXK-like family protein n=1 Tax=Massilia scottii TaxID=3057166 RepID=UPI00279641CA|nr:PD-(D/E)XK nuclease family protein [Massilia sp. CCM 9210]MDQ1815136.1 PD-(D/E)XK nuclease family protein [Massilia sp. CCM 9210]
MKPEDLYKFLSDPDLTALIETSKTTDDVFDVFDLYENQHSELLAWCMNPNEGHGQGDAVIKDFLEAAYYACDNTIWDNKKFFQAWTPGKIRTTSFGAAFVTREFTLKVENGTKTGRLDLFLVDPQNKLLVTIENKAGAKLAAEQLDKYVQAVKSNIASKKAFADYQQAYVVLDRDLSEYADEDLCKLSKRWALLDYTWLSASAKRARFQLERGSRSAQLLVAYCQRQTDWESEAEKRASELAINLAIAHPTVLETMRVLDKQSICDWKPLEGHSGELIIFLSQHHSACEKIIATRGVAMLVKQLVRAVPELTPDYIGTGRKWLTAFPPECRDLMQPDEEADWPVYADLFRVAKLSRPDAPRYNLHLVWVRNAFDATRFDEPVLRSHFANMFVGLSTFVDSNVRRILIAENMTPETAIGEVKKLLAVLSACMRSVPKADIAISP